DAGVGHLGGRYRVVARDRAGIHHAGKAHVFAAAVDGDLLLARNLQVAVGQHTDDSGRQRAAEHIGRAAGSLAFGFIAAAGLEVLFGTKVGRQDRRGQADVHAGTAVPIGTGADALGGVGLFLDHDRDDVAHVARPAVFEQGIVAVGGRLVDGSIGLRGRRDRRRGRRGQRPRDDRLGRHQRASGQHQRERRRPRQTTRSLHGHPDYNWVRRASIWSDVCTALLFISKARWVVIMFTSSSATLPLDVSTQFCSRTPAPSSPGCSRLAGPDASVSAYRFSPMLCSPVGLLQPASCSWPTSTLVPVAPGWVTDTVPSRAIVMDSALSGILMPGWMGYPPAVTSMPFWSRWMLPSRV